MSIQEKLENLLRELSLSLKFDRAGVLLIDENKPHGFYNSFESDRVKLGTMFLLNDPVMAQLNEERTPIIISDIDIDDRFLTWPDMQSIRGWMGVPIHVQDRMLGILSIGSLEPFAYSEEDIIPAIKFSEQAAVILAQAVTTSNQPIDEMEGFAILDPDGPQLVDKSSLEVLLRVCEDLLSEHLPEVKCVFLISEHVRKSFIPFELPPPIFRGDYPKIPESSEMNTILKGERSVIQLGEQISARWLKEKFSDDTRLFLSPMSLSDMRQEFLLVVHRGKENIRDEILILISSLAQIAGSFIDQAFHFDHLSEEVRTRTKHLVTLYSINALPGKNLPLEVELSETLRLSIDPLNAQAGSVFLQTDDEHLNLVAQSPDRLFEIKNLDQQIKIDQNFWRELFQSSNPLVVKHPGVKTNLPEWLLPDGSQKVDSIAVAAVRTKEQIVGLLVMYSIDNKCFGLDEKTLLLSVADQIGMVVEREILVRKSEATAVMEERHRLARELHDSITQMLYSQVLFASAGLKLIESGDTIKLEDHLNRINQVALQALREMRLMVYELRPAEDFDAGLESLIEARLDAVEKRTGIDAELEMQVGDELSPEVTEVVYKIIHEALNNSLKHSNSTKICIKGYQQDQYLLFQVVDNGTGFDIEQGIKSGGLGLQIMKERASQIAGTLKISSKTKNGTKVELKV